MRLSVCELMRTFMLDSSYTSKLSTQASEANAHEADAHNLVREESCNMHQLDKR